MSEINQTSAVGTTKELSLNEIARAMSEIGLLPVIDEWVLISPGGQVYKGKIEQIAAVVIKAHPLMKGF